MRNAGRLALLIAGAAGGLTVYLAFSGGGYHAGVTGIAAVLVAGTAVLWVTLVERPFAGLSVPLALVATALALFAAWTLVSASWSDAPSRAVLEFNRALLYTFTFFLLGCAASTGERLVALLRALAAALVAVVTIGLITRVLPEVWPIGPGVQDDRLSYPVTYWNALGMLAAIGILLCVHLSASRREPRAVRIVAAAPVPLLAAALYFTLSRGSIIALAAGLLLYVGVARSVAIVPALLATIPVVAIAIVVSYQADLLTSERATSAAAVDQGQEVALYLLACALAAAGVRALLLGFDSRLDRWAERERATRPRLRAAVAAAALVAIAGGLLAVEAPAYFERQYDRFVEGDDVQGFADQRSRLTNPGNNGRLEHWEVALDAFREEPATGAGAGTYHLLWLRDRPTDFDTTEGHSLYVEVLAELGFVGFVLIALALLVALGALIARARGPERSVSAVVLGVLGAWMIHAGIDWDWEMPVVTLPALAITAAGLSRRHGSGPDQPYGRLAAPSSLARVVTALALLLLAVTPALAAVSQHRLNRSVDAFKAGDCELAIDAALDASDALPMRPEPWEVIGYCDLRLGAPVLGVRAFRNAVSRDPDNWEVHYGLALALGIAGRDPRPAARKAVSLNPREAIARSALRSFSRKSKATWRRTARSLPLPIS